MASDGGGKVKQKRNQTPGKPYERKSSLFGKLKDSVKDLLIPSWLSGTPTKQEKSNEKAPTQPNEEARQGGRAGQVISDWTHGTTFQVDNRTAAAHLGGPSYGNSAAVKLPGSNIPGFGYQPPNGDLRADQLPVTTPVLNFSHGTQVQQSVAPNVTAGGSIMTRNSDSSVVSGNIGHRISETEDNHPQYFETTPVRPIMVSTGIKSSSAKQDTKRQRLWSPQPLRQGKPLVPPPRGKPTFNSLLFGTPSKGDTSTMASGFGDSSFYVGKTCYGGASSAKRKSTMNTSLPYQSSLPLRKQVRATKMNSSFHATTSSTAQRILDTLERMSTPLEDAKKIPQGDQGNDSVLSFTPSSYRRQTSKCSVKPITRPLQIPNRGPPTSQLQGTPQVEIARNRDRSRPMRQDSDLSITQETVSITDANSQLTAGSCKMKNKFSQHISGQQEEEDIASIKDANSQLTSGSCKMKTKKFSQHISGQQEEEVMIIPNLRTDFTLPLSSMAPIVLSSGSEKPVTVPTPSAAVSHKPSCGTSPQFTFATPIEKNRPLGSQFGRQADQAFKFSSPIHVSPGKAGAAGAEEGSKPSPEPAVGAATPPVSMWTPQMMKPKAMAPDIGGTSSSFKSYTKWNGSQKSDSSNASPSVGLPVATTLKKGSVMDILGGSSNSGGVCNNTPLSAMFKKPPGSWECDTCMIRNTADSNRCVACTAPKPGSKSNNAIGGQDQSLSTLSKNPTGSWKCATCMKQNDVSANKCAACSASKPGSKSPIKGQDSSKIPLSELFKKPEGTWDCSLCMIQNTPSVTKCVACETPKPGAKSDQDSSKIPLSELFKKPEGTWDCSLCMIQNTPSVTKCVACETPKPGAESGQDKSKIPLSELFKKPEGTWDCSLCMIQNAPSVTKCVACETPKPGAESGTASKSDNSLAAMFKMPEGSWECDTCMVHNNSTALRCIACNASKPGLQSAGIVSKPSSTKDNQMTINPSGGFSLNFSTTTTTTGSAGIKFGSASASVISSNAAPPSTGFNFGNKNTDKDSNSSSVNTSSNNTTKTTPLGGGIQFGMPLSSSSLSNNSNSLGGIQFGAAATVSSGATTVVSTASSVNISSGGFRFGAPTVASSTPSLSTSSSSSSFGSAATNVSKPTSGFQFGAPTTSSSDTSAIKAGLTFNNNNNESSQKTSLHGSQTTFSNSSSLPSSSTSDNNISNNKAAVMGGFQFGSSAPVPSLSSSAIPVGKKSETPSVTFGAVPPSTKSQSNNSPFVFGAPVSSTPQQNAVGLGMGQSLAASSASSPLVNGVFGSGHDPKKSLEPNNTGFNTSSGGFAFGSKQNTITKRTLDSADNEAPSAKASLSFGTVPKEPTVNGGFNFNANAGSFAFGSSHPAGGFQFTANPAGPAAPAPATAFAFTAKPSQPLAQSAGTSEVSFSTTPNFNFSATPDGNAVFQFGSKATSEQPSSNMFTFGAASSNAAAPLPSIPVFGAAPAAAAAPNAVGSFNMGSADTSQRKMKKAVRRIKPR